jgi:hypothetical protein
MKFNTTTKIHKYKRIHEKHHFNPMAMEMHNAPQWISIVFSWSVLVFFTLDNQKVIYSYFLHSIF